MRAHLQEGDPLRVRSWCRARIPRVSVGTVREIVKEPHPNPSKTEITHIKQKGERANITQYMLHVRKIY